LYRHITCARITLKKVNLSHNFVKSIFFLFVVKDALTVKKEKIFLDLFTDCSKTYHQKTMIYKLNELSKSEELDSTKTIIKIDKNNIVVLKSQTTQ